MKTEINHEITEAQAKVIALKQFNDEPCFLIECDGTIRIIEGTEEDVRAEFKESIDGMSEDDQESLSFDAWALNNREEVEPIDDDDEVEGYIVLTDEEADEKCKAYIEDTLWAFNADFIIGECGLDFSGAEALRSMQEKACESANDFIRSLVDKCTDIDSFVQSAVSADGRGHFMNTYDGHENEESVDGVTYYIYRIS